jgi:sugar lactone lactonase YvrE
VGDPIAVKPCFREAVLIYNASGRRIVPCLLAFLLASCAGATVGTPPAPPTGPTGGPPARATTLYVSSAEVPGSLGSVPATASGTVKPRTQIDGERTGLAFNYFDWYERATGRLWVTNCLNLRGDHGPLVAFRAGASGDPSPAVSIGGAATGLTGCQTGVTVDGSGDAYVADITNSARFPGGHIAVFRAGSRGNVRPARQIFGAAAGLRSPTGVALGPTGELYVADSCQGYTCAGDVRVFAPNAGGDVAPIRTIAGPATGLSTPEGVALDSAGNLYVANMGANTITVYAAAGLGDVAPIRTIAGANTRLDQPAGLAIDALGYLYVGTGDGLETPGTKLPVLVFSPSAKGNAVPHAAITFAAHRLDTPSGVALH